MGCAAEQFKDRRDVAWQWLQQSGQPTGWGQDPPRVGAQNRAIQDEVDAFNLAQGPMATISIDPLEIPASCSAALQPRRPHPGVRRAGEVRDEIVRESLHHLDRPGRATGPADHGRHLRLQRDARFSALDPSPVAVSLWSRKSARSPSTGGEAPPPTSRFKKAA